MAFRAERQADSSRGRGLTHLGAWYAASAISGILATLAVSAWGFYAALGGRPLFGDPGREAA